MQEKKYEFLLAAVISARATSFIFSKIILQDIRPFNVLAIRFLAAFLLMALLFHREITKLTKKALTAGLVLGFLFFVTMAFEMLALKQAASSLAALLENCAIFFVPLFELALFKKIPGKMTVLTTAIAMAGVVLLAVQQGNLTGGFTYGLLSAMTYALAIIATDRLTGAGSPLGIGIVQVGVMGALSLLFTCLLERPQLPQTGEHWLILAILTIVCTGFGFTLQPVAQSRVTAQRAGVFCAISPAIAVLLGVAALHERLGLLGWLGLLLILASLLLPYLFQSTSP